MFDAPHRWATTLSSGTAEDIVAVMRLPEMTVTAGASEDRGLVARGAA
jgi:hypothetical protein